MDDGLPLVGVIGAGTMGAGIAQVAAVAGHRVLLADAVDGAAGRAVDRIRERVKAQVAKGRLDADPDALDLTATEISELGAAGVVVEAVVEDLGVKRALFSELEQLVTADCLLASNSSSLTPTAMAAGLAHPERLVGLHFFNPVPVMQLVEVISGLATAASAADRAEALAQAWGKTVVRSAATPGVHRQPDRPPVLRGGVAAAGGARGRSRHDRRGADRGGRVPDGAVRADGPHRP